MATVTDITAPQGTPPEDPGKQAAELFRYSAYVDVGPGAEGCEAGHQGSCEDPEHFHAWCRLPNQFQHSDVRQKSLAAKARRLRQLRDPATDSYAILEADLDDLARLADPVTLIDEIVGREWWKRQLDAMRDVEEREEYEHVDRDRERLGEIELMDPEQRPTEELEELGRHLGAYSDAIQARVDELAQPQRDALTGRDLNALVDLVREDRINAEATTAFMETYAKWQMFAGTLRPAPTRPTARVFEEIGQLEAAAPEVIEALRATFNELEVSVQRGNS